MTVYMPMSYFGLFQAFKQELNYATHLGLPAVMMPITGPKIMNLARCLNEHLLSGYFQQVRESELCGLDTGVI